VEVKARIGLVGENNKRGEGGDRVKGRRKESWRDKKRERSTKGGGGENRGNEERVEVEEKTGRSEEVGG